MKHCQSHGDAPLHSASPSGDLHPLLTVQPGLGPGGKTPASSPILRRSAPRALGAAVGLETGWSSRGRQAPFWAGPSDFPHCSLGSQGPQSKAAVSRNSRARTGPAHSLAGRVVTAGHNGQVNVAVCPAPFSGISVTPWVPSPWDVPTLRPAEGLFAHGDGTWRHSHLCPVFCGSPAFFLVSLKDRLFRSQGGACGGQCGQGRRSCWVPLPRRWPEAREDGPRAEVQTPRSSQPHTARTAVWLRQGDPRPPDSGE